MNEFFTAAGVQYVLAETCVYPNGGSSRIYVNEAGSQAVILDRDICAPSADGTLFPYTLITNKQNEYMNRCGNVYRFLEEDREEIEELLRAAGSPAVREDFSLSFRGAVRDGAEASPLELQFEQCFTRVYGMDALRYLWREYGIPDPRGNTYFLDYYVRTGRGDIGVEENGVTYHHPQVIGKERYRRQLRKQNVCMLWGIRLFRFSSEDCRFEDRMEDDIREFFGGDTSDFLENGILARRTCALYEHQALTLQEISRQRAEGKKAFLVVFPTASGKSRIVEEDLRSYAEGTKNFRALILAPSRNIVSDWEKRLSESAPHLLPFVDIRTYAGICTGYAQMPQDRYCYIVVDEAHHAVAPVLKRVIQYFTPDFLVGLTATDQRPDRKKLEEVFGAYRTELSLQEAMEKEIIARANVFRIETNLDLSHVRFNGKEYVNADLEKSIRVTSRNELIADVLNRFFAEGSAGDRQGIVFCVNTAHAQEMERVLTDAGIPARAYTSKTKNPDQVMEDFRNRQIRFLCACGMISEGWDYPELGILVMARPTMSKVLYLQQVGRGLRRTDTKKKVFVIDVVDEYGTLAKPCSMHAIFANASYVPFGDILKRDYAPGDVITVDGIHETVERVVPVDIETFDEKYGDYLNEEQLAREFFMSTGSITSWIRKGKIQADAVIPFGSRRICLFSPESVRRIREENGIPVHDETTIRDDFFAFLEERDYSLSYKMPFVLSFLKHMNAAGEARIEDVLTDYIAFYQERVEKGLKVDRANCPYSAQTLHDRKMIRQSMLTNPFEKFERKRFLYYAKNLGMIAMNPALYRRLSVEDLERVEKQMREDLENYYRNLG